MPISTFFLSDIILVIQGLAVAFFAVAIFRCFAYCFKKEKEG